MSQSPDTQPLSRRERKKLETRDRIIDAAFHLMSERSYDDVKVEDICELADIANATFFVHFPAKSALMRAFSDRISIKIADELANYDIPATEKLELLRAILLDELEKQGESMRGLMAEAANNPDASRLNDQDTGALHNLAADIIAGGQAAGEFSKNITPKLAAIALIASWTALALSWAQHADNDRARRENREILDVFLFGLTSKEYTISKA